METLVSLLPLLLIFAVFWLLILRPARTRQRDALRLQSSLAPGQEVMTTAGLYASVVALEDDVVVLETAPGVRNRYARGAVARVLTPTEAPEDRTGGATASGPADG